MGRSTALIGIVGSGYVAERHSSILVQIPQARIAAYCDTIRDRAERLASRYGGKAFTDFVKMMDAVQLDAVFLCTPPSIRLEVIEAAATRGVHVFVEKPIALTLEEGKAIVATANSRGITLHVGYAYRYHDVSRSIKERIESGELGTITQFAGRYWGGIPGPDWWTKRSMGGGQLVEQATHVFDLGRFLLGDIESVCAVLDRSIHAGQPHFEVEDSAVVIMKFKEGPIGYVSSTCDTPFQEANLVEAITVGSRGMAVLRPRVAELILIERPSGSHGNTFLEGNPHKEHSAHPKEVGYFNQCQAFIRNVLGDPGLPLVSGEDALLTLATCLAAHHSYASQHWVEVDAFLSGDLDAG